MALIYPSKWEGFGLPPVEAMKLGTPVITTNKTSIPEVCEDAVCYTDIDNIQTFIDDIAKVQNDEKYRNFLIEKGYIQSSKYNWEKTASLFLDALRKNMTGENA